MSCQRWKLSLAYNGEDFSGWQSQADRRAVQDHIERALLDLAGEPLRIHGAGRTDAGVHAEGQCAHLDAPAHLASLNGINWRNALNTRLPLGIRILSAEPVAQDFHARFSASRKTYRYRIAFGSVPRPSLAPVCWYRRRASDPDELRWLAQWLAGRHDFRRLSVNRRRRVEPVDTIRLVRSIIITRPHADQVQIDVCGDGFLYKMVRMIVASLIAVAEGLRPAGWLIDLLRHPSDPGKSPFCAPAHGLCLMRVDYTGQENRSAP